MIKHLEGLEINSIYDFDNTFSINELLCKFWEKIEETINISNESIDILNWVKEQGLTEEIEGLITQLVDDGTIERMINVNKIEELKNNLKNIIDELETNTTNEISSINNKLDGLVKKFTTLNINVGDYGIDNTGNTDVTNDLQVIFNKVRDYGGGRIIFPSGEYYVRNYVDVYSNTHIIFEEGCTITKKGGLGSETTFAINRLADNQPYGYSAKNITFEGGTFNGCKLGLGIVVQKVKNLTFKNMKFIDCMLDSHILDLQGVNNCLVENCIFEGRYPVNDTRKHAECIQFDISSETGAPSFSGADGTKSNGIIIRNCTFKPNDNDGKSKGLNAFGTHSSWNCYHENIIFENNTVIDCENVMIRLPNVKDITIQDNQFINRKGNKVGAIELYTPSTLHDISTANNSSPSIIVGSRTYPPKNVIIDNNKFEGFRVNENDCPIVKVRGGLDYQADNVIINNNIFTDCLDSNNNTVNGQDCIYLSYCDNAIVNNNNFFKTRRMIYANNCNNLTIKCNTSNIVKSSAISLTKCKYVTVSSNSLIRCYLSAIYILNSIGLSVNNNIMFENAQDNENSVMAIGSCVDGFITNNFVVNKEKVSSFGLNVFKTPADPSLEVENVIASNNVYKGVSLPENFSSDVIDTNTFSGLMVNGCQAINVSKLDDSITIKHYDI